MAVKVWGGGTNDPPVGNAWTTANNWTGDAVPVANDDVVFNGQHGNEDCTVGINPAIVLDSVTTAPDYSGTIGVTGVGLKLSPTSIGVFYIGGTGAIFADTTITTCEVRCDLASAAVELDGIITDLILLKGTVTLVAGVNVLRIFVSHIGSRTADSVLTIPAGVFLNMILTKAGTTTCASTVGDYYIYDGSVTHTAGDVTTLTQIGGTFAYDADSGTYRLARADIYGGVFDGTGSPLPHLCTTMTAWRDATVDLRNTMNNWAITNGIISHNATIYVDPLSTISIS